MSADAGLLDGLKRQLAKYREMAVLAEDQRKVFAGNDLEALVGLVERKRGLLQEIETIEKELAPLRARWPELRAGLDAAAVVDVEAAVEETKRLLADIIRIEDEGRRLLEGQRRSTADDLKDLMVKRRARGAYGGGEGGPRFVDGSR